MEIEHLLQQSREYLPPEKLKLVEEAYKYASEAHTGQKRASGEPFMEHPLQTASILAELQLDAHTLAAALLHDVVEDAGVSLQSVEKRFGPEVAKLVGAVTKMSAITWRAHPTPAELSSGVEEAAEEEGPPRQSGDGQHAENLRRMLLAMAEDLRVVFVKLADRLHNMRTLAPLSPVKRKKISQETLEIFAPLADRVGMWEVKWQLEDLAFRYLEPKEYHHIARQIAYRRTQREAVVQKFIEQLKAALHKEGIKAEVTGRPKHIYSIYQKSKRYAAMGKEFSDIHDLFAVRVLVDTVPECYRALGAVHSMWHPLTDEFDDYIANPKDNGYQSLHTTLVTEGGIPLEVQIRTHDMHRVSDYGVAAHWRYKDGGARDEAFDRKLTWLRQLIEWQKDLSGEEFVESVKTDIFIDQVFVFTPKGEIKVLPRGATPLDFAYRVHTELGHRCSGSRVNGRMVPLSYHLKSGDVVEIITHKGNRGPSLDWLNPNLGLVNTSHAKEKIRQWFKKQKKVDNVQRGRELLDRELKRMGITAEPGELARLFDSDVDDFLAALGYGGITPHQVTAKVEAQREKPHIVAAPPTATAPKKAPASAGITIMGVGNLLTHIAHCCHPLPGEDAVGYITRNRGVTVHRRDCYNVVREPSKERLVAVQWGEAERLYPATVVLDVMDRVGLLRDVTTVVAEEKVNIGRVDAHEQPDHTVRMTLELQTKSMTELSKLLSRLSGVRGVISAERKRA
ncbi:MAG: bifunctional (p)ppGpp synthetase/guanosine-3',5'-bis(diphosphate) 3'-pyrophosphohydrolase [Chloroflexi bacterium]|nr:bifunctional (p)ppGpp synthetase/guanosine-3',5'-bis(diphosphate) 3'-pyrophosphohydrolase [Chloroflexota bacterium]